MMYLIGQLAVWLLLTALFAALAGWAFAIERAQPARERMQKDRDALISDLSTLAGGEGRSEGAIRPEAEAERSLASIRDARLVELERTAQEQRTRADGLAAQLAHAQRGTPSAADTDELQRLRALVAAHEQERARIVDAVATPAPSDEPAEDVVLQAWRLRYFEKRVKYLEGLHATAATAPLQVAELALAPEPTEPPTAQWRAREAEARANFLADEVRRLQASAGPVQSEPAPVEAEPASPFAANADVDVLLRWRMLYLERRVAHLQTEAANLAAVSPPPAPEPLAGPAADKGPDLDRWKWRARYLESRVRHLEDRAGAAPEVQGMAAPEVAAEPPPPPPAPTPTERPPGLPAAQGGAADDFTLIDNIGPLQQTTLYSLGIYHFEQIAVWTPSNVAWVDRYLRLQGRIGAEEWLQQAADLAREGPEAARRQTEEDQAV